MGNKLNTFVGKIEKGYLICYLGSDFRVVAHLEDLNEDTAIGILSHETIEYLLACLRPWSDIHRIIGGGSDYEIQLPENAWIDNKDGLPNLKL